MSASRRTPITRRSSPWLVLLAAAAAALWVERGGLSGQAPAPPGGLAGIVRSAAGAPLEGVAVSARARQGKPITTSVWTDRNGRYHFPPLDDGEYRVWAQAVGFDRPLAERRLQGDASATLDFTLKPIQNYELQLSTAEWLQSLPDGTAADRRMKHVLQNVCSTCHQPGFVLEKRFDAAGWELIINQMLKIATDGDVPQSGAGDPVGVGAGGIKWNDGMLDARGLPAGPHHRIMSFYKQDLVEYLSRVRGPTPFPIAPKPFPRPTGAATRVVVVEYDAPPGRGGGVAKLDPATGRVVYLSLAEGKTIGTPLPPITNEYRSGSDWRLGTRSEYREGGRHDVGVGSDGHIYYGGSNMEADPKGENVWFGSREFMRLDVRTQTIEQLAPSPVTMTHGKNVDSKGNLWASTVDGAVRLNLATRQITEFKTPTPYSRPYDMAIDGHDNVWLSLIAVDKMGVVDGRTGDVTEVPLQPYTSPDLQPRDYELARTVGSWDWTAPLMQLGPRRLGARGDHAWVGLFWTGGLAKLDGRTKTLVKQYDVPNGRWIHPYKVLVDRHGMVWFGNANADLVGMFNPQTEQFTMYPLPTRGSNVRHLAIDDMTDPPTIWLPYISAQKIARLQVRPATGR